MPASQGKKWCFTLNNYTDDDQERLRTLAESCTYLVFGREVGENGTPHLQGFVVFATNKRFRAAKSAINERAHIELARGTCAEAATYCKKDDDYEEFGALPNIQGKTNRYDDFKKWVLEQPTKPTERDVASEWPSIFMGSGRCMEFVDLIYPKQIEQPGEFRDYQQHLANRLDGEPDGRKIIFVIDEVGGTGKSWFVRKWMSMNHEFTQCLSIGKRDDIAHVIDESKRVFFFDLPRSQSEYLQYSVLEQLKDQMVFSPKYNSRMKMLTHKPHVVVFMNERPDMTKLSQDRYDIINWNTL